MNTYDLRCQLRDTDAESLLLLAADKEERGICPAEVRERLGDAFPFARAATELRTHGLAQPPKYAGCAALTPLGVSVANEIIDSRRSGEDRELRVQLRFLQWLHACSPESGNATAFLQDDLACVDDLVVDAEELAEQVDHLVADGLVTVTSTLQSKHLRPRITDAGKAALRMGSVHRHLSTRLPQMTQVTNDYSVRVDRPQVSRGGLRIVAGQGNVAMLPDS